MEKVKILWADDEIDLLKPHIMFLQEKGYDVGTANNGNTVLELVKEQRYDIIFLDEHMPGLTGIETLTRLKSSGNDTPVVMITKSEEENIMEDAIGSKIADYLIKPVNPHQILLSIKKTLDNRRIVGEKTSMAYQQEFRNISIAINERLNHEQWAEVYKKLIYWELELEKSKEEGMAEVLEAQKREANNQFARFVQNNYTEWLKNPDNGPVTSHQLFKKKAFRYIEQDDTPVLFVLIDNLRYDQWKVIQPVISEYFEIESEESYYSILPTATQFARNSIFAGLMPSEIEKRLPNLWVNDDDEGGKNLHEEALFADQMQRLRKDYKFSYTKVTNTNAGKALVDNINNLLSNKLSIIVYNFVDMLSHARTEMEVIRELASDEKAYRSITLSWIEHSPLWEALKKAAQKKVRIIITTDHGTIRVTEPVKIVGDRNVNTNLRYKQGKSLSYNKNEVFEIKNPVDAFLPRVNLSTTYVFARGADFFAYPNNYNHYVSYYRNTFQHGGLSLEEMIIPFITLRSK